MKYAKPEVSVLARAVEAIQGSEIKGGNYLDANGMTLDAVTPAYQLDE